MDKLTTDQLTRLAELSFSANANDKACVFLDYFGNVNEVEVSIHFGEYEKGEKPSYTYRSFFEGSTSYAECIRILEELAGGKENGVCERS